jgi:aspartate-semialdehyde dehydrogenase
MARRAVSRYEAPRNGRGVTMRLYIPRAQACSLVSGREPAFGQFEAAAQALGAVVVDNSSFFRMDPKVPLVVPEINAADVNGHQGIIANPNCTTAISLMALNPLHQAFGVKRIFASSYQAVSGTGAQANMEAEGDGMSQPARFMESTSTSRRDL